MHDPLASAYQSLLQLQIDRLQDWLHSLQAHPGHHHDRAFLEQVSALVQAREALAPPRHATAHGAHAQPPHGEAAHGQ